MAKIISASINVAQIKKIDKAKLIEGNNGAKYLNIDIIVNDKKNEYGKDVFISLQQSKEERFAKANKTVIGNGKVVWSREPVKENKPVDREPTKTEEDDDSLPF